jgi:hypothetical protein
MKVYCLQQLVRTYVVFANLRPKSFQFCTLTSLADGLQSRYEMGSGCYDVRAVQEIIVTGKFCH